MENYEIKIFFFLVENKLVDKIDIKAAIRKYVNIPLFNFFQFLPSILDPPNFYGIIHWKKKSSGEEEKCSISGWRISKDGAMINIDRDIRVSSDKVA